MSDDRLRAAIIGTGRIGSALERDPLRTKPHTHAGWYVSHPHILLSGGADTSPDRLAEFGAAWDLPAGCLFASYPDLLAALRPDLVSVCAYAPERVAMAQAALRAGARGLWLEKAVATSVASARDLRLAAAAAGASVVVNHPRGQDPHYRAVRRNHRGRHARAARERPRAVQRAPDSHRHPRLGRPRQLVWAVDRGPHLAGHAARGRRAVRVTPARRRGGEDRYRRGRRLERCNRHRRPRDTSASPTAWMPSSRADGRAISSSSSI